MDFAIEYSKRMRALLSSFFVPKYAIKAAGGRFYVLELHLKKAILKAIGCVV